MRLAFVFLACAIALAASVPASAAFWPVGTGKIASWSDIRRSTDLSLPVPARQDTVSVLVQLRVEPLATLDGRYARARSAGLDLRSPQATRRLSAIAREQAPARARLNETLPRARITARHRILLNALSLDLPTHDLAQLEKLPWVDDVFPSLIYRPQVDRGRGVIGADALEAAVGSTGAGVKIAIVDDGIDPKNPLFSPKGLTYPPGFPKGNKSYVSRKVIVARSFTTPDASRAARRPLDRRVSFHGSHVAGIAAGAPTVAEAGADHPRIAQIRGVAPSAFLGNYRVFNEPSPIGNVATTSQIISAFEAAVRDGMDIINFSGGGIEIDPERDALVEAVANATRAGVLVVASSGNSRDALGAGTITSPAIAPEALAVGAVTSDRVFAPALSVVDRAAPPELSGIPYSTSFGLPLPARLTGAPIRLLPVESLLGLRGEPVRAQLCSPRGNPNHPSSELPGGSLLGAIAIVQRGVCSIASKVDRARRAGAIGVALIDNRAGEPASLPIAVTLPTLILSDLDGRRLIDYALDNGGALAARLGRGPAALVLERQGVVAAFSSVGPTAFGHQLKPDISAPGVSILSAANAGQTGSSFTTLAGTSMAAPHVSGATALLLQKHPEWEPWQLKSTLMSTATQTWKDTERLVPAPPTLSGAGLVAVAEASNPLLFTLPASLSLGDLQVRATRGATATGLIQVSDAGGGEGDWTVQADVIERPTGVLVEATPTLKVTAGGTTAISLTIAAPAGTPSGGVEGRLRLARSAVERSVPFYAFVTNPLLASLNITTLRAHGRGSTADSASVVGQYRFPSAPLGPPSSPDAQPMNETGGETVFRFDLPRAAINAGVAVIPDRPGVRVDPFILSAPDENAVLGLAATPVTANGVLATRGQRDGAAAVLFPKAGRYWVVVDSGVDSSTRRSLAGSYRIRRWVNDLEPPKLELLTRRLARGRGTVAVRALDAKSGVDPLTLTLNYGNFELAASQYDYETGVALFRIPRALPRFARGRNRIVIRASDHQEAKNVYAADAGLLKNSTRLVSHIRVDESSQHVSWLLPTGTRCVPAGGRVDLAVSAAGPSRVRAVRFRAGGKAVGLDRKARFGDLFETSWDVPVVAKGRVRLVAEAIDLDGRRQKRLAHVRICRATE